MDAWLEIVVRQVMLYSLPVLVSLTVVGMIEARFSMHPLPHPFYPLAWRGSWLPCLAGIVLQRGVIVALPRPVSSGLRPASLRMAGHALLCVAGFLLYAYSLDHASPSGLPPLPHWWAKVLMFFNLCMLFMHLLPLPGMLLGEWLLPRIPALAERPAWRDAAGGRMVWLWALLAASPLPDVVLGRYGIFPVYGRLAGWAYGLGH